MILTLDEYKLYLPINATQSLNATITEASEIRALYKWFPKYLGNTLVEDVAGESPDADLLAKVKPVLANFTYLESLPFLNLVLTGSGFGIISNPNMAPASTERIKALASGLLEAAHNFLDSLLSFLEENSETYSDWNQCSLNPGSLLASVSDFDDRLKINNSRTLFITLIPHIKEVETLVMAEKLSDEFLSELILGADANVKPLFQYACAFWAWERMMSAKYDLPGKPNEADYIMTAKRHLYQKYNPVIASKVAEGYFLKAVSYLNKHLTDYPTYQTYAYEAPYENIPENGFFIT